MCPPRAFEFGRTEKYPFGLDERLEKPHRGRNKRKGRLILQTVFFRPHSNYEGIGARLYRSCGEIKEDMDKIREKIDASLGMLNIRTMLTEAMARYAEAEPEVWIPELEGLVAEADATLAELNSLRDTLDILKTELEETRWAVGV